MHEGVGVTATMPRKQKRKKEDELSGQARHLDPMQGCPGKHAHAHMKRDSSKGLTVCNLQGDTCVLGGDLGGGAKIGPRALNILFSWGGVLRWVRCS